MMRIRTTSKGNGIDAPLMGAAVALDGEGNVRVGGWHCKKLGYDDVYYEMELPPSVVKAIIAAAAQRGGEEETRP